MNRFEEANGDYLFCLNPGEVAACRTVPSGHELLNSFSDLKKVFIFSALSALPNSELYFLRIFKIFSSVSISEDWFCLCSTRAA